MSNENPKPMKRVDRNIFKKVGKKLEKFEQNLGIPTPNLSRNSLSSSDLSTHHHHHHHYIEDNQEQDDTVSLNFTPETDSGSTRGFLQNKSANRSIHLHSSIGSNDVHEFENSFVKDSTTQYNQEIQMVCQELMENKVSKLQNCREYDKKVALLRIAISFNNPKVIEPVLIFLEHTLSKTLFYELIKQHSAATKTYINMAKLRLEYDHYIAMLKYFGRNEEVAMLRIRQASQTNNIDLKIPLIDQAAIELHSHPWWHTQLAEYQYLLQKQRELQKSLVFTNPNIHLENQTALETYKTLYDIDFRQQKYSRKTDDTIIERRREIATGLQMCPEIVLCGKLSVIMRYTLKTHYDDFVKQTAHQTIFGKKYLIAPENFAEMVYNWVKFSGEGQEKASEKAGDFLSLIQNPTKRIYYAEKFQNYHVAMDTIANVLRDRVQLENLRKRMPQDNPSFNRITALLENTKWKN